MRKVQRIDVRDTVIRRLISHTPGPTKPDTLSDGDRQGLEIHMALLIFVLLVAAAASTGAIFKPGAWYEQLRKPGWTPPNFLFPIVWTLLYIMIAWAGWRIWRETGLGIALAFWAAQWVFNSAWSWLFFGRRRMDLGLLDICLLWISVAGFILTAWPVDRIASLMFLPYLLWVSIAALLNLTVLRLNASEKG